MYKCEHVIPKMHKCLSKFETEDEQVKESMIKSAKNVEQWESMWIERTDIHIVVILFFLNKIMFHCYLSSEKLSKMLNVCWKCKQQEETVYHACGTCKKTKYFGFILIQKILKSNFKV